MRFLNLWSQFQEKKRKKAYKKTELKTQKTQKKRKIARKKRIKNAKKTQKRIIFKKK